MNDNININLTFDEQRMIYAMYNSYKSWNTDLNLQEKKLIESIYSKIVDSHNKELNKIINK